MGGHSKRQSAARKKKVKMSPRSFIQTQLQTLPERTLPLLRAIATNQQIRFAMAGAGYNDADQAEGWQFLLGATGYAGEQLSLSADDAARQAITELDNWDEPGYRRIHAALGRLHPEQDAFVFNGLEASRGPSAVLGVARLLDRLDQLEKGTEADRAAMATLEKRGINAKLRAYLRSLVNIAQAAKPMDLPVEPSLADDHQKALEALNAWYQDWSETARAVIHRRDHLILMGLAKRRSHKDEDTNEDVTPPMVASSGSTPTEASVGPSATPSTGNSAPVPQTTAAAH